MQLALAFLGKFEVLLEGQPVTGFQSDKARALLVLLAVEADRPYRREQLAGMFWPDVPDATARTNLRSALLNLRHLIGGSPGEAAADPPFLTVTRDSIQFNALSDYWLDVAVFSHLLAEATPLAAADDPASASGRPESGLTLEQVEKLAAAIELYRGAFLEGVSIRDCPAFDTWANSVRERLVEQAAGMMRQVSEYYQHSSQTQPAIAYARRWVDLVPWQEDAHYHLIRLLKLSGERTAALAQYETCRRTLAAELGVEPSTRTTELYESIRTGRGEERGSAGRDLLPTPGVSPYKGLQYFDISDAGLFFGREALTARMLEHLRQMLTAPPGSRCLAVVGASGSGKSSLVRAGLAAVVQRGDFSPTERRMQLGGRRVPPGPEKWAVNIITPTAHPLAVLASLTAPLSAQTPPPPAGDPRPRLLVVDQFEELFTLCHSEPERAAFIEQLLSRPDLVVIALRADFYAPCALYPALRQALTTRQEYLGAMDAAELHSAIEEPARRGGWKLEPGLVDLILRDVGAGPQHSPEPGALPLLSHALLETWKRRSGRMLTIKGYTEAGGVQGVIAKTAETVFAGLDAAQQITARRIFLRLTELGEDAQDTRRRASLADLVPAGGSQEATLEVVRRLASARLVVLEWDPVNKQEELEMAHEALIQRWPRLRGWLEDNRAELRLAERLRDAAQEWQAAGRSSAMLVHRGERLESALLASEAGRLALNQSELDYLVACRALRDREHKAQEHRRRLLIAASLAVTGLMSLITLWGMRQADEARQQAEISLGQQLAAQAGEMLTRPLMSEPAMLLAIEAVRHSPDRAANEVLASSLSLFPQRLARMDGNGKVTVVGFSPDGQHAAAASLDHTVRVWDSTGQIQAMMRQTGPIWSLAFSPDGRSLVYGGQDGQAVISTLDGHEIARLEIGSAVEKVAFSPDGRHVAAASESGAACVWEAGEPKNSSPETQSALRPLGCVQHAGIAYNVVFSPDGTRILSAGQDGLARIWSLDGVEQARIQNGSEIWSAAFSPDGARIITAGWDGVARVWNISKKVDQSPGDEIAAMRHHEDARVVAFSPDGVWVLSAGEDGSVRVWEADSGREVARMQHQARVLAAAFSPNGAWVISASEDGAARVWEAGSGREVERMQHNGPVTSAVFSPDGQRALTGGWDGEVNIWQLVGTGEAGPEAGAAGAAAAAFSAGAGREIGRGAPAGGREVALMRHDGGVAAVAYSPDGQWVASGSDDGTARVWSAEGGAAQEEARMQHGGRVISIAFSPDGRLVISGSEDNTARVWDAHSGRETGRMQHSGPVTAVAFSPDGRQVVSGSQDGLLRVWPAGDASEADGSQPVSMQQPGPVSALAFSPDGRRVVSASASGLLLVWDISHGAGREIERVKAGQAFSAAAISPDGRYAVTGSAAGMLQVWQMASGHEVDHLLTESPVTAVAISPGAKWILSGGKDGSLSIWGLSSGGGRELARIQHSKAVNAAGFSHDSRQIVSGSQDGGVRLLLWQNEDLVSLACARLTRNLTLAEWEHYMGDRPYQKTCPNLPGEK